MCVRALVCVRVSSYVLLDACLHCTHGEPTDSLSPKLTVSGAIQLRCHGRCYVRCYGRCCRAAVRRRAGFPLPQRTRTPWARTCASSTSCSTGCCHVRYTNRAAAVCCIHLQGGRERTWNLVKEHPTHSTHVHVEYCPRPPLRTWLAQTYASCAQYNMLSLHGRRQAPQR